MWKALWACVSMIAVIMALASCGLAVEREISGVRLGDRALGLLDKPGYGEPNYLGPLGTIAVAAAEATRTQGSAGGVSAGTARSGPSGPSGARASGARASMGGGMSGRGGGMRGGMGGGMRGGMGGGGMGGGGRRGGTAVTGGTVGRGRTTTSGGTVQGPGMYWYYRRPSGAVVVLSLDLEGKVTQITLSGIAPTPGGRTSQGIGLGNSYMDVIAKYGYPDQTVSSGSVIQMSYVDDGVRFVLDAMRVREIAIGANVAAQVEAAPAVPGEFEEPPAGMSIEELRGYL